VLNKLPYCDNQPVQVHSSFSVLIVQSNSATCFKRISKNLISKSIVPSQVSYVFQTKLEKPTLKCRN
jgi:hypothetical protein